MYPPSNSTTTSLSTLRHIFSESEFKTVSEFDYIEKFLTLIPQIGVTSRSEWTKPITQESGVHPKKRHVTDFQAWNGYGKANLKDAEMPKT
jgi:hypothetical protein